MNPSKPLKYLMLTPADRRKKIQQRIHREELKLARLKSKVSKSRSQDTRMKLRLGGFIYVVEWEDQTLEDLAQRFQKIFSKLKYSDLDQIQSFNILGSNVLRKIVKDREYDPSSSKLSADEKRSENHRKITIGGLMVKYRLHEFDRPTLFGALLDFKKYEK